MTRTHNRKGLVNRDYLTSYTSLMKVFNYPTVLLPYIPQEIFKGSLNQNVIMSLNLLLVEEHGGVKF